GKGIAGALLMANLQANLRSQCIAGFDDPERLLRSVNQLFYDNTADSSYATLFFAEYDDQAQRFRYANCAHLSGLVLRRIHTLVRCGYWTDGRAGCRTSTPQRAQRVGTSVTYASQSQKGTI